MIIKVYPINVYKDYYAVSLSYGDDSTSVEIYRSSNVDKCVEHANYVKDMFTPKIKIED